jgi:hypothetical protein
VEDLWVDADADVGTLWLGHRVGIVLQVGLPGFHTVAGAKQLDSYNARRSKVGTSLHGCETVEFRYLALVRS